MKVHHLNCATLCPRAAGLIGARGPWLGEARLVCHCLLIEATGGLVLVDTGLGLADIGDPEERLGRSFVSLCRPRLDPSETAASRVIALGYTLWDVTDIVLTHLDLDHSGGLPDFPRARVHVHERELEAALSPSTPMERRRYARSHLAHVPRFVTHRAEGERWMGFECVKALEGSQDEVLLVPLFGHSRGHAGVAVRGESGWLLHAGDAYFHHDEIHARPPWCPPGLRAFQAAVEVDRGARLSNQARLRALARERAGEVRVFSAHDPGELSSVQPPS